MPSGGRLLHGTEKRSLKLQPSQREGPRSFISYFLVLCAWKMFILFTDCITSGSLRNPASSCRNNTFTLTPPFRNTRDKPTTDGRSFHPGIISPKIKLSPLNERRCSKAKRPRRWVTKRSESACSSKGCSSRTGGAATSRISW